MSDLLYYLKSEMLESELEAAKLREAELTRELNAANKALMVAMEAFHPLEDPAALAERDRAIEKRTAERCAEIVSGYIYSGCHALQAHIRRVFNLDPKPEAKQTVT